MSRMDIHEILEHLPHRYPILLVDRVLDVVPGERIVALKNVSVNEPFFPGHYPHHPVMPGVLIVEALSVYYFVGIDGARFKRPVSPGDQLILEVSIQANKRGLWKFAALAKVEEQIAAEAELMCTVRTIE